MKRFLFIALMLNLVSAAYALDSKEVVFKVTRLSMNQVLHEDFSAVVTELEDGNYLVDHIRAVQGSLDGSQMGLPNTKAIVKGLCKKALRKLNLEGRMVEGTLQAGGSVASVQCTIH